MEDYTLRPSMKTVWAAYTLAIIILIAAIWALVEYAPASPHWVLALPLVVLIPPAKMHLSRRLLTLRFHDDHLTIESGFFSRVRRTIDTAKIQDVTVKQTLGQRLLGTGDISLESAGEHSAVYIANLDRPRVVADAILHSAKRT
jgi:uncharacterized membrane protein YdbT with pleckstrin-like domain